MSPAKSPLDELRIERRPERPSRLLPRLVIVVVILLFVGGAAFAQQRR